MEIRELLIQLRAEKDTNMQFNYSCLIALKALQQVRPELEPQKKGVALKDLFHQPYLSSLINNGSLRQCRSNEGLCDFFRTVHTNLTLKHIYKSKLDFFLDPYFKKYPNYSGDNSYPIRCELAEKQEGWSAEEAAEQTYILYRQTNRNLLGPYPYGAERWKFINWLAEILENELLSIQKQEISVLPNQLDITD